MMSRGGCVFFLTRKTGFAYPVVIGFVVCAFAVLDLFIGIVLGEYSGG
jgi:hypothetical protein